MRLRKEKFKCVSSFDITRVLREAKFINAIMVNSEIWHNVQFKHVQCFEKIDADLLRKILDEHFKTAMILELEIHSGSQTIYVSLAHPK